MEKLRFLQIGSLVGSAVAAATSAAASICCVGPLALSLLGVNGAILAAGMKPYRPYLLGASLLVIGYAFWAIYGRRRKAADGVRCSVRAGRAARSVLWVAATLWVGALLIGFAADRYWL